MYFQGEFCEDRRCPRDCSGAGTCDKETGICTCQEGFIGIDCAIKKPFREPIMNTVKVSLVWGISGYHENNKTQPVYVPDFDFDNPTTQNWLSHVCSAARNLTELLVRDEVPCWIDSFRTAMSQAGVGFPVGPALRAPALEAFFSDKNVEMAYGGEQ